MKYRVHKPGQTLLAFLREEVEGRCSVKGLKRLIEGKGCRINGRVETFSTHPVKAGDIISLDFEESQKASAPLKVVYEDEALLVCNKPPGLVCTQDQVPAQLVHRLDKETSGLLLLAKTAAVKERLIALFKERAVKKAYLALVEGRVKESSGKIVSRLRRVGGYEGQSLYASGKVGEEAITFWERLALGKGATLLLCKPVTGRTHQIRVHLKEMGHPILGDYQYHRQFSVEAVARRHMLHAYRLAFSHPVTGERVEFEAPIPEDFREVAGELGITLP